MTQDFTVPVAHLPKVRVPATPRLMEKWTGAMLDASGRAHCGALRLDFEGACNIDRVFEAIADTLSESPILAASFDIEGKTLSGQAPTQDALRAAIRTQLENEPGVITDADFLAHCGHDPSVPGLRLAASRDGMALRIWIGFWIFTCDGASIDLLVQNIARRYRNEDVPALQSWDSYAATEIARCTDNISEETRRAIYSGEGPFGLDACRTTAPQTAGASDSVPFVLNLRNDELAQLARKRRVTPFAMLFGAFQRAVSKESGLDHIVTGVPFNNRQERSEEFVIGPLANTIPVVTRHSSGCDFDNDVKAAQGALLEAARRQHLDTARLFPDGMSPRTSMVDLPFPQLFNAFNAQTAGQPLPLADDVWLTLSLLPNNTHRVPFEITLHGGVDHVAGRFEMDGSAYGAVAPLVQSRMAEDLNAVA